MKSCTLDESKIAVTHRKWSLGITQSSANITKFLPICYLCFSSTKPQHEGMFKGLKNKECQHKLRSV